MNRTLKRPMFRKGGTPNEGIMSGLTESRPGYADGTGPGLEEIIAGKKLQKQTQITEPYIRKQYEEFIKNIQLGGVPETDVLEGLQISPPPSLKGEGILELIKTQPEKAYEMFKTGDKLMGGTDYATKQQEQIETAKAAGLDLDYKLPPTATNNNETANQLEKLKELTKPEAASSQFEKYFQEYLPVIQEQLKPDTDEIKRSKFLELAKVGLGILAQPGGDIAQVVGKAAAPAITNLQTLREKQREEEIAPKLLALQAAMKRMDGPTATELGISAKRIETVAENLITNYGLSADASYKAANSLDSLRITNSPLAGKFNQKQPERKDLPKKGMHCYFNDSGDLKVYNADKKEVLSVQEAEALET